MRKLIPILIGLCFIGITFYLSIQFENVVKNSISKTDFGWVITTILLRIIISISFARGAQLIFKELIPRIKTWIIFVVGIIIGFSISFITPIYESDYGDFSSTELTVDHEGLSSLTNSEYEISTSPYILTFFTTNCPHCKNAAQLLGFAKSIDNAPKIITIFPGAKDDADDFIKQNNASSFIYHTIDDDEFFVKNSGAIFPSIFLIDEKGQTIAHWFGDDFNYTALDYIESYTK